MGAVRMEQLHHVKHGADFIGQKNRELFDERPVDFGGGLWQVDFHEERGAASPNHRAETRESMSSAGFLLQMNIGTSRAARYVPCDP